jgi:hypothetical protein
MNEKRLSDAEHAYQNWSDEELVRATTADKAAYESWALALITQELSRRGLSQSLSDIIEKVAADQVEGEEERLTGIRGWLLWFIVSVLLNSLLHVFFGLVFLRSNTSMGLITGVLSLMLAGYGLVVFYLLIRKKSTAPRSAELFLILGFIVSLFGAMAGWMVTHRWDSGGLLFAGMSVAVWLTYLHSSRRVANTYRPTEVLAMNADSD